MKYFRSSWLLTALFLSIAFIYGSNIFSSTGFSFGSALQALLATAVLGLWRFTFIG